MKKVSLSIIIILLVFSVVISGCSNESTTPATETVTASSTETVTATVTSTSQSGGKEIVINAIINGNQADPSLMAICQPIIDGINSRLEGEVKINLLGGAEVIPTLTMGDALQSGVIDLVFSLAGGMTASVMPASMARDLSQLTGAEERESGAYDVFVEAYAEIMNVRYLGLFHSGGGVRGYLYVDRPINSIEDFSGMRLRTYGVFAAVAEALGATPNTIGLMEVYTALQRGVVDGCFTTLGGGKDIKINETSAKYIVEPGIFWQTSPNLMNLDVWNRLSAHAQEVILDEMEKSEARSAQILYDTSMEQLDYLLANGMEITELDDATAEAFIQKAWDASWDFVLDADSSGYAERLMPLLKAE